jgi:hypothetical protein
MVYIKEFRDLLIGGGAGAQQLPNFGKLPNSQDGYNGAISLSTLVKLVYLAGLLSIVLCHAATLGVQFGKPATLFGR